MERKLNLRSSIADRCEAGLRVAGGKDFDNHSRTIRGRFLVACGNSSYKGAEMVESDHRQLIADLQLRRVDYVIFSYETPIAWHRKGADWFITDHRYSATSQKHRGIAQSIIRYAEEMTAPFAAVQAISCP